MKKSVILGDWVEIERIVLEPNERNENLPMDTKTKPYKQWIRGNLQNEKAEIGDEVSIKTLINNTYVGILVDTDPKYTHNFGDSINELIQIRKELKKEMETL